MKKALNNLKNSSKKSRAVKDSARAFLKRVQNSLHKNNLLPKEATILVAVSGGADSMALLHALHKLQPFYSWSLSVAHINYGLRGKDSLADFTLVKTTAQKLNLPFYSLTKKKISPQSSEEKLRDIRYLFFDTLVKEHSFERVALAHHQDDQAETILMRLIRGSGLTGLAAMRSKRDYYVRPFLQIPKNELLQFINQENIPFRHDTSNDETFYLRNKVRHELLPLLESYNPGIKKVLATTASLIQTELLQSKEGLELLATESSGADCSFLQKDWLNLELTKQAFFIRQLFTHKNLQMPSKKLVDTLVQDFSHISKKGFVKEYSRLRVRLNDDRIYIHFNEID